MSVLGGGEARGPVADFEEVSSEHSESPHNSCCVGGASCCTGVADPVMITLFGSCDASSIGKVVESAWC